MKKFKAALRGRVEKLKKTQNKVVRVGVIGNQHYEDGTPVAYVAAIHEFGSPSNNIPPRSFFRPTMAKESKSWAKVGAAVLKQNLEMEEALDAIGMRAAADIKATITQIHTPPLAESTIRARNRRYKSKSAKRSVKPLVDTGLLLESISYEVVEKEAE